MWQSAAETAHDVRARLAIVHMVHEARGLDVTPSTIQKLERNGDQESAELLKVTLCTLSVDAVWTRARESSCAECWHVNETKSGTHTHTHMYLFLFPCDQQFTNHKKSLQITCFRTLIFLSFCLVVVHR